MPVAPQIDCRCQWRTSISSRLGSSRRQRAESLCERAHEGDHRLAFEDLKPPIRQCAHYSRDQGMPRGGAIP
ncbi:hypothetical protein Y025_5204 [Burkholderia pseudomallei TSV32]|nr:hypothetical protein Y025_5204 [Burkholderia pseudomallei TSV32]